MATATRASRSSRTTAPSCASGAAGSAASQFRVPHSVAIDRRGDVYVADRENSRVQVFDARGRYRAQWVSDAALNTARAPYSRHVSSISYDATLDLFAVTEGDGVTLRTPLGCAIVEYGAGLKLAARRGAPPASVVAHPGSVPRNVSAMAEDAAYTVFVAELDGATVRRLDSPRAARASPRGAASAPVSLYGRS